MRRWRQRKMVSLVTIFLPISVAVVVVDVVGSSTTWTL